MNKKKKVISMSDHKNKYNDLIPCPHCGFQPKIKKDKIGKFWAECQPGCGFGELIFETTKEGAADAWTGKVVFYEFDN